MKTDYLRQIQIGIDFIENNLDFDISLQKVSQKAGISQWHFQRIFKALTNETLKAYIRSRRLAIAIEKLITTNHKIIDIAITAGFDSQESFTRAFKKAFDITPNRARTIGNKNQFSKKIEIDIEYLQHINNNISLKPEIIIQRNMHLVGIKTLFYNVDSEKNNMANKLPSLWDEFIPRMGEIESRILGTGYGVIQQTVDKTDLLEYYAACEVTQISQLPKVMVNIEIAKAKYALFTHEGLVSNINNTVNYIYSNWLMQSGFRHTYGPDLEIYGARYIPDSKKSVIHYAIPIA